MVSSQQFLFSELIYLDMALKKKRLNFMKPCLIVENDSGIEGDVSWTCWIVHGRNGMAGNSRQEGKTCFYRVMRIRGLE